MKALLLYIFTSLTIMGGVVSTPPVVGLLERVTCMEENIYAVQRTANDKEYRLGLFHVYENANEHHGITGLEIE